MAKKYFLCTDGVVRAQEEYDQGEDLDSIQIDQTYLVDTSYTDSIGLDNEDIANQIYYHMNGGQTPEWLTIKSNNNWKRFR